MRTVYLGDKFIRFTSQPPMTAEWIVGQDWLYDVTKLLQNLENYKGVYIKSSDPDVCYDQFCRFFRIADAGGGVVRNLRGDILMIHRRGVWDLPKGWREEGETYQECALREVMEECALTTLILGRFITSTEHIYPLGEGWILKRCMWYEMSLAKDEEPQPQIEEEITEVRWIDRNQVREIAKNTFATIQEVIAQTLK